MPPQTTTQTTTQTPTGTHTQTTTIGYPTRIGLFAISSLGVAGWLVVLFNLGLFLSLAVGMASGGWYAFFSS